MPEYTPSVQLQHVARRRLYRDLPPGLDMRPSVIWANNSKLFYFLKHFLPGSVLSRMLFQTGATVVTVFAALAIFGQVTVNDLSGVVALTQSLSSFAAWTIAVVTTVLVNVPFQVHFARMFPPEYTTLKKPAFYLGANAVMLVLFLAAWLVVPLADWNSTLGLFLAGVFVFLLVRQLTEAIALSLKPPINRPQRIFHVMFFVFILLILAGISIATSHALGFWALGDGPSEAVAAVYLALLVSPVARSYGEPMKHVQQARSTFPVALAMTHQTPLQAENLSEKETEALRVVQEHFETMFNKDPDRYLETMTLKQPGLGTEEIERTRNLLTMQHGGNQVWLAFNREWDGADIVFEIATAHIDEKNNPVQGSTLLHLIRMTPTEDGWKVDGTEILESD